MQILSQGEYSSPMISGLVRIQGGIMSQGWALETEETHCQFHLSVTRSQCETGKRSWRGSEWGSVKNYCSCMNLARHPGTEIIPSRCEQWPLSKLCQIVNQIPFCYFPAVVCPQANLQCITLPGGDFNVKIYYSSSEGVVVSRNQVWWTGTAGLEWFLQLSIICKNGSQVNQEGFHTNWVALENLWKLKVFLLIQVKNLKQPIISSATCYSVNSD